MKGFVSLVTIILITMCVALPVQGTIVSMPVPVGTTLYVGGSGPGNYTTIQAAIDDASYGDTVFVYGHPAPQTPYEEKLLINKSIQLIGEDRETTIINGIISSESIRIEASTVTIQGFTIKNQRVSGDGILIAADDVTVNDNIFTHTGYGVRVGYADKNIHYANRTLIQNNIFEDNLYGGIITFYAYSANITGNVISSNNGTGIVIFYGENNVVLKNHITQNQGAIGISSDNNMIQRNDISGNLRGVTIHYAKHNAIVSNNIQDDTNYMETTLYRILFKDDFNNTWDANYWGHANISRKLIAGRIILNLPTRISFFLSRIIILGREPTIVYLPFIGGYDEHPAQEPYDLPLQ